MRSAVKSKGQAPVSLGQDNLAASWRKTWARSVPTHLARSLERPVVAAGKLPGRAGSQRPQHLPAKGLIRGGQRLGLVVLTLVVGLTYNRGNSWLTSLRLKNGSVCRVVRVDEVPVNPACPVGVVVRD